MIDVNSINLKDMLPESLKKDKTFIAIAEVLQAYIDENFEFLNRLLILADIDGIEDEKIIDHLAYQFHVDFYDEKMNLDRKKAMVKNSIFHHRIKGTPEALDLAISTVFDGALLEEWFEYDSKPYFFRASVEIPDGYILDSDQVNRAKSLINEYKNTRSWLEYLLFYKRDNIAIQEKNICIKTKYNLSNRTKTESRKVHSNSEDMLLQEDYMTVPVKYKRSGRTRTNSVKSDMKHKGLYIDENQLSTRVKMPLCGKAVCGGAR